MSEAMAVEERIRELRGALARLREQIEARFLGQRPVVDQLLLTLLAGGHALLEGAPGLGKTTLVRTVAAGLDLAFRRIQFTPDLMPPDVIGTRILEEDEHGRRHFLFERGPIFTQVLLADEVNRATPRTQSALLEAMQERQVTVFGETHALEVPFVVFATQNPIEMEGTYPLPEAQLDRFLLKIVVQSPDEEALVAILDATTSDEPAPVAPVVSAAEVLELQRLVRDLPASSEMLRRAARLVLATRPDSPSAPPAVREHVRWGASPRGAQALLLAAKARALLAGRLFVATEDLDAVAAPALRHRLVLGYEAEATGIDPDTVVSEALGAL